MGSSFISPLRYPGGKGVLAPYLGQLLLSQFPTCSTYVEPFAGGAGAAVRLLHDEFVERIVLNDLDAGITAMWRSVFNETDAFVDRIQHCDLSVGEWRRQRSIYNNGASCSQLDLGFAAFYLNRTNRSGILRARPIGGLEQTGKWKIDARFNRSELATRVRRLGRYRNRVSIQCCDAIEFLDAELGGPSASSTFAYIDPPYIEKSRGLYLDEMEWADHERLADTLNKLKGRWVLTYDHDERVSTQLYPDLRNIRFDIAHTAAHQYVGSEFAVFSNEVRLVSFDGLRVSPDEAEALLSSAT